jgi:hypothetical protein
MPRATLWASSSSTWIGRAMTSASQVRSDAAPVIVSIYVCGRLNGSAPATKPAWDTVSANSSIVISVSECAFKFSNRLRLRALYSYVACGRCGSSTLAF